MNLHVFCQMRLLCMGLTQFSRLRPFRPLNFLWQGRRWPWWSDRANGSSFSISPDYLPCVKNMKKAAQHLTLPIPHYRPSIPSSMPGSAISKNLLISSDLTKFNLWTTSKDPINFSFAELQLLFSENAKKKDHAPSEEEKLIWDNAKEKRVCWPPQTFWSREWWKNERFVWW